MLAQNGALADIDCGRRAHPGMRLRSRASAWASRRSPSGVSLRTFNRNFEGRSGTARTAQIYLVSSGGCRSVSALTGVLTDPRTLGEMPDDRDAGGISLINDNMIVAPARKRIRMQVEVVRGPNIKPFPLDRTAARGSIRPAKVAAQDRGQHHHRPHHAGRRKAAAAIVRTFRTTSQLLLCATVDPEFPARCKEAGRRRNCRRRKLRSGLAPVSMPRLRRCIWASRP